MIYNNRNTIFFLLLFVFPTCTIPQESYSTDQIKEIQSKATVAAYNGEWQSAAEIGEQWIQMQPYNYEANYHTVTNYLRINQPSKAISIWKSLKEIERKEGEEKPIMKVSWREARLAKAYYMKGDFKKVLGVVEGYPSPKMYRGLAREHLKALIQLGRYEELEKELTHYQQVGIYRKNAKTTDTGFLFRAILNELVLVENDAELEKYISKFHSWIGEEEESIFLRNAPWLEFYKRNYDLAIKLLETALVKEKSKRHLMEMEMLLGVCFAKNGDLERAKVQIKKIHALSDLPNRHDAFGAKYYHQARIESAMQEPKKAIHSLRKALEHKAEFWSYKFMEDSFLKTLFKDTEFQNMVELE